MTLWLTMTDFTARSNGHIFFSKRKGDILFYFLVMGVFKAIVILIKSQVSILRTNGPLVVLLTGYCACTCGQITICKH